MINMIPSQVIIGFLALIYLLLDIMSIRFVEDNLWCHLARNNIVKTLLYIFAPVFVALHSLIVVLRHGWRKICRGEQ